MSRRNDWLHEWLQDWANDVSKAIGYSDSTVLSRAMAGQLEDGHGFNSSIPKGVVHFRRDYILRLHQTMEALQGESDEYVQRIRAVQYHYLVGPGNATQLLECASRTFRKYKKQGLELIKLRLQSQSTRNL